jgi:hypothetical protein
MHSSEFEIAGYENPVIVHHNGDWSGEAIVVFQEAKTHLHDKKVYPKQEVTIPARLLIGLALPVAQEAVQDALVGFAEDLPHILRVRKAMKA